MIGPAGVFFCTQLIFLPISTEFDNNIFCTGNTNLIHLWNERFCIHQRSYLIIWDTYREQ